MTPLAIVLLAALQAAPVPPVAAPPAGQAPRTTSPVEKPWPPPGVQRLGPGITAPVPLNRPKPRYTAEAMQQRITGEVHLEAVVEADGSVGEVRVTRSLDKVHGLDGEAVKAAKEYRFKPAAKGGAAVPVVVMIILEFNLRDRPPGTL